MHFHGFGSLFENTDGSRARRIANKRGRKSRLRPRAQFDSPPHPTCDIMSFTLQEDPHMSIAFSRRAAILGAAALRMIRIVKAQPRPKFIAISSANRNHGGINACAKSVAVMRAGGHTLDALTAGVNHVREAVPAQAVDYAYNPPHGAINCIGMNEKERCPSSPPAAWRGKFRAVVRIRPLSAAASDSIGMSEAPVPLAAGKKISASRSSYNCRKYAAWRATQEAALDCLKRMACNFDNDEKRLAQVGLGYTYCVKTANTAPPRCGRATIPGSPFVPAGMRVRNGLCTSWTGRANLF
jgi:hypothetical protein